MRKFPCPIKIKLKTVYQPSSPHKLKSNQDGDIIVKGYVYVQRLYVIEIQDYMSGWGFAFALIFVGSVSHTVLLREE